MPDGPVLAVFAEHPLSRDTNAPPRIAETSRARSTASGLTCHLKTFSRLFGQICGGRKSYHLAQPQHTASGRLLFAHRNRNTTAVARACAAARGRSQWEEVRRSSASGERQATTEGKRPVSLIKSQTMRRRRQTLPMLYSPKR